MTELQIPNTYLPGFNTLADLQQKSVDKIIAFIKNLPLGTGPETFIKSFYAQIGIDKSDTKLAETVYSLGTLKITLDKNEKTDDLVKYLCQSFERQTDNKSKTKIASLKKHLTQILSDCDQLVTSFKAFNLLAEHDQLFKKGHISTDLRLVFNEDIKAKNRSGLIIHQLRVVVEKDDENCSYYFSLNSSNLLELKKEIEHAIEKEDLIRSDYNKSISFINITE